MSNILGSRQFGRYVEVEIRDFKSQTKTIIGNDFEIDFEYFKSLDQVADDNTGKIKIYGLTPERIAALQDGGGEVILRCKYQNAELEVLFHAYIARMYAEVANNTTMTTIECSSNLMNYYQTGTISTAPTVASGGTSFGEFFVKLGLNLGAKETRINPPKQEGLTDEFLQNLETFVNRAEVKSTFVGSHQEMLEGATRIFGMEYTKTPLITGGFAINFFFGDAALERIGKEIASGYKRISLEPVKVNSAPSQKENSRFKIITDNQTADSENREIVWLTNKTGLISLKIEYKVATAYADQELFDHEAETVKSQQDGLNKQARLEKAQAREAEKVKKAAAKGKVYTPKASIYRTTIKINRKYARVKALLNPTVKPQGIIAVPENVSMLKSTGQIVDVFDEADYNEEDLESIEDFSVVLRVRSVMFKGNNKRNDWIMDIYAENPSKTESLTDAQLNDLQRNNSPEDITIESEGDGELNDLGGLEE